MSEKTKDMVIYVRQNFWQSIASDAVTFSTVAGIIGIGAWLDSSAMQWAGFIMAALLIGSRGKSMMDKLRMTPQQAADRLLAEFGVTGRDGAWKP
jgi:hypothetical protein